MKRRPVLLLLPLALPALGFGQTVSRPQSAPVPLMKFEAKREADAKRIAEDARRSRVVSLVVQTAEEAGLWDDREGAVLALAEAADLLWDDSAKARGWLLKSWDLIAQVDERENSGDLRQIWRGSGRSSLRTRVLAVARKRDPQIAERFLKSLETSNADEPGERGAFDDRTARSEQLLRLSLAAVDSNPPLALTLAERSLQDGISFNLQTVLLRLRQKDSQLADRLFDSALARLGSTSAFRENQILASYLFQPGQVLTQLPNGTTTMAVVQTNLPTQTPAAADPNRAKRFLAVVQQMMLSAPLPVEDQNPQAGEFVLLAASLAPAFQTYAPELWQPIQARAAQFATKLPAPPMSAASESQTLKESAGPDASAEELNRLRVSALEKEAERQGNPIARKLKFAEAALTTDVQDFEHGKSLAGRIENDDELRDQIVAFLAYRAALTFLHDNKLQNAEEVALLIPSSPERALALIAVAQKLAVAKPRSTEETPAFDLNRQRAIELLFEADRSLKREGQSAQTAKIRLGKIAVSNLVDGAQAFSDFEQAIAVINRLDKFDATDGSAPRFGISGFSTAKLTVPRLELGFGFRSALEPLIKQDFELTAATIERLASPSVRGTCRLEIARLVLPSLPKPTAAKVTQGTAAAVRP